MRLCARCCRFTSGCPCSPPSPQGTAPRYSFIQATHIKVLAVDTLADLCAGDASLEALAVLLEAGALLAVAALGVAHAAVRGVADALGVRVTLSGLQEAGMAEGQGQGRAEGVGP